MSPKKRTIIEHPKDINAADRVIVEESIDSKDQPSVMAYRLGSLEQTVKEGFKDQSNRLEEMVKGFVTEKELLEERNRAEEEHKKLWGAIKDMRSSIKWWVTTGIAIATGIAITIQAFHK